jgi:hypothetical protein
VSLSIAGQKSSVVSESLYLPRANNISAFKNVNGAEGEQTYFASAKWVVSLSFFHFKRHNW